jgi:hypothetical protein
MLNQMCCKKAQVMKKGQSNAKKARAIPPQGGERSSDRLTAAGPSKRQGLASMVLGEVVPTRAKFPASRTSKRCP